MWFAVVTSYKLLLSLVIFTTSKAYRHARHSHNSQLQLPQEQLKVLNSHSTTRYVRLCTEEESDGITE